MVNDKYALQIIQNRDKRVQFEYLNFNYKNKMNVK